jgi:biopolymer transport protein ExbB/TolQ
MGSGLEDVDGQLAQQVAVNTDNITRLFAEHERIRERLHAFESDRAAVLLLAQKVDNLSLQLPSMIERAAEVAAEHVEEMRSSDWRTWAALVASMCAVVGLLATIWLGGGPG